MKLWRVTGNLIKAIPATCSLWLKPPALDPASGFVGAMPQAPRWEPKTEKERKLRTMMDKKWLREKKRREKKREKKMALHPSQGKREPAQDSPTSPADSLEPFLPPDPHGGLQDFKLVETPVKQPKLSPEKFVEAMATCEPDELPRVEAKATCEPDEHPKVEAKRAKSSDEPAKHLRHFRDEFDRKFFELGEPKPKAKLLSKPSAAS